MATGAGCGTRPSDQTEKPGSGDLSQAITNGTPVGADTLGSVRVGQCPLGSASCCPAGASSCNFVQQPGEPTHGCSGTMVAPRWLLTSGDCVKNDAGVVPASGIVALSADRASFAYGQQIFVHPDPNVDVALVYLSGSVVDANGVAHTTPLYTGSASSMLRQYVYCQGFGDTSTANGGSGGGTLRSSNQQVDQISAPRAMLMANGSEQSLYFGDYGAGCFIHAPGTGSNAIYGVQTAEQATTDAGNPLFDFLITADAFLGWAQGLTSSDPCSRASATCGTISDAFGNTMSCGTCAGHETCYAYACTCKLTCPRPSVLNATTCECETPCGTPRQCCIAEGGVWDHNHCS
jgi:hypothetical protein